MRKDENLKVAIVRENGKLIIQLIENGQVKRTFPYSKGVLKGVYSFSKVDLSALSEEDRETILADESSKRIQKKNMKSVINGVRKTERVAKEAPGYRGNIALMLALVALLSGSAWLLSKQPNKGTVDTAALKSAGALELQTGSPMPSLEPSVDPTAKPSAKPSASSMITAEPDEELRYDPANVEELAKRVNKIKKAVAADNKNRKDGKQISTKDATDMIKWFTSPEYVDNDTADRAENTLGTILGINYFEGARKFNRELKTKLDPSKRVESPLYDILTSKEGEALYEVVLDKREALLDAIYANDSAKIDKITEEYVELGRKIRGNIKITTGKGDLSIDMIRSAVKNKEILVILDTFKYDMALIAAYNPEYAVQMDLIPDLADQEETITIISESDSLNTLTALIKQNMQLGKNFNIADCIKQHEKAPQTKANYYDSTRAFLNGGRQYKKQFNNL